MQAVRRFDKIICVEMKVSVRLIFAPFETAHDQDTGLDSHAKVADDPSPVTKCIDLFDVYPQMLDGIDAIMASHQHRFRFTSLIDRLDDVSRHRR